MLNWKLAALPLAIPLCAAESLVGGYTTFHPKDTSIQATGVNQLDLPYDLATSMTDRDPSSIGGSISAACLMHATNNHDYLIVTQIIPTPAGPNTSSPYRASVLDITDPAHFSFYALGSDPSQTTIYSKEGIYNASVGDQWGQVATSPSNPLAGLHVFSNVPGTEFSFTYKTAGPIIFNHGGELTFPNSTSTQWSLTSAPLTQGWITVNGAKVDAVLGKSLAWMDRQWGPAIANFDWFGIHIVGENGEDTVMSMWHWVAPQGEKMFTTSVKEPGNDQTISPIKSWKPGPRTFTSPQTNVTYALDFTVTFYNGLVLELSSVRPDQEIVFPAVLGLRFYTGFFKVDATYPDGRKAKGNAVSDRIPLP